MKKCSKCNIEFDLSHFNKDKSSKDGLRSNCKSCAKEYRERNSEKQKEYRERTKLRNSSNWKEKYYADKTDKKLKNMIYYQNHKDRIKEKSQEYYSNNKEKKKNYQKNYQENNREKRNKYLAERRQNDEMFRLITNIRNLILNSFYEMGYSKNSKTNEILGCTFDELKFHLESKFESWMNWNNRGIYNGELNFGWDIDHIIPLSDAKNVEDLYRLNHYTNLQPLCSKVNRDIKKNKLWQEVITH
jgi:hypothetical protein